MYPRPGHRARGAARRPVRQISPSPGQGRPSSRARTRTGAQRRINAECDSVAVVGRRYPGALTLSASAAVLGGCLLFTDEINGPPEVEVMGPTALIKGESAEFSAVAKDPDQSADTLFYQWHEGTTCPQTLEAARQGTPAAEGQRRTTYMAEPAKIGALCIWAVVRDSAGAAAFSTRMASVDPGKPKATIEVVKGKTWTKDLYSLYNDFRLSGAKSQGSVSNDSLTFSWTLTRPGTAAAAAPACADGPKDVCFPADVPGSYVVELTVTDQLVSDPTMASARDRVTLAVDEDRPPCIEQTAPQYSSLSLPMLVWEAGRSANLEIHAVSDDGDPLPDETGRSRSRIIWEFRKMTAAAYERYGPEHSQELKFPIYEVVPDDVVLVRVRYEDRITRDFSRCDPDGNCQLPAARDRGQPCYQQVTWKIRML
jgi:hypothetical protein